MMHTSPLYSPQFEHDACGIGAVVDKYFTSTISRVEGVGLEEIGEGV